MIKNKKFIPPLEALRHWIQWLTLHDLRGWNYSCYSTNVWFWVSN